MRFLSALSLSVIVLSALGACSPNSVREQLGVDKGKPDEFAVIRRAPLEINDDILASGMALPRPQAGAARPQEISPEDKARKTVLGQEALQQQRNAQKSTADQIFLQRAGAAQTDPSIRSTINAETSELHDRNKPVAERIFGFRGDKHNPSATVVNAEAEAKRIYDNKQSGRLITEGETPSIEE